MSGYPRTTLSYWAHESGARGSALAGDPQKRRKGTKEDQDTALKHWQKARGLNLREMADPMKVKKATLRDNTLAAGVSQDKITLLSGDPTAIVGFTNLADFLKGWKTRPALGDGVLEGQVTVLSETESESKSEGKSESSDLPSRS